MLAIYLDATSNCVTTHLWAAAALTVLPLPVLVDGSSVGPWLAVPTTVGLWFQHQDWITLTYIINVYRFIYHVMRCKTILKRRVTSPDNCTKANRGTSGLAEGRRVDAAFCLKLRLFACPNQVWTFLLFTDRWCQCDTVSCRPHCARTHSDSCKTKRWWWTDQTVVVAPNSWWDSFTSFLTCGVDVAFMSSGLRSWLLLKIMGDGVFESFSGIWNKVQSNCSFWCLLLRLK